MKIMIHCWLAATMIVLPSAAYAGDCRAVTFIHRAPFVEKVIVKEIVPVVETKVIAVGVPTYNSVYIPTIAYAPPTYTPPAYAPPAAYAPVAPVAQGACASHDATMRQLAQFLQQFDGRLQRLEGGPGQVLAAPRGSPSPAPSPPGQALPMPPADPGAQTQEPPLAGADSELAALAVQHCSACHDRGRAQASGKGLVLTEGDRFVGNLTPELLGETLFRLSTDGPKVMPPRSHAVAADVKLKLIAAFVAGPAQGQQPQK